MPLPVGDSPRGDSGGTQAGRSVTLKAATGKCFVRKFKFSRFLISLVLVMTRTLSV